MFTVIPLVLSMLLATAQQETEGITPLQSSALSEWLESRSDDRQPNVGSQ